MRNTVARHLARTAIAEMTLDRVPARDLVEHPKRGHVINAPKSVRALYLGLKQAYKKIRAFVTEAKHIVVRTRKGSGFYRKADLGARPAIIQSPLKQIQKLYPPSQNLRGEWEQHPIYLRAAHAAIRGDGATVQRLARAHV